MADKADAATANATAPADALRDDWDSPLRVPDSPELHLDGFDGGMDLLLDLIERERIDLSRISVVDMIDQFLAAMARYERTVKLERRADWLVVAARVVQLRSRLLLPRNLASMVQVSGGSHQRVWVPCSTPKARTLPEMRRGSSRAAM